MSNILSKKFAKFALVLSLSAFNHLFGVLCLFQHYTGHITTGSFVGGGHQYIQLLKILYCKLLIISYQLPTFPHKVWVNFSSLRGGRSVCNHGSTVALLRVLLFVHVHNLKTKYWIGVIFSHKVEFTFSVIDDLAQD